MRRSLGRLSPDVRGFAKDTGMLSVAQGLGTVGLVVQVALITRSLGVSGYGTFALVVSVVGLVSRFFDVQVGQATVAFGADRVKSDAKALRGILQFGYLVDFATGVVGFAVIALISPFVGPSLIGDDGTILMLVYGATLLASTVDNTSIYTLMLLDRYGVIVVYHFVRETLRVAALAIALVFFDDLVSVVVALLVQDAVLAVLGVLCASRAFSRLAPDLPLRRPALESVRELRRPMLNMIFHTNFISYARIVQTQVPALVLGVLKAPYDVGLFKIGTSAAQVVARAADPAWSAVLPRLSRLWAEGKAGAIRRLVLQSTAIAAVGLGLASAVIVVFREPLLRFFAGSGAAAAGTVLVIAVLSQALNGVLFWNSPLLIAAKRQRLVSTAYVASAIVLVPLVFAFTELWGAVGAAIALAISLVQLNVFFTVGALRLIRR